MLFELIEGLVKDVEGIAVDEVQISILSFLYLQILYLIGRGL